MGPRLVSWSGAIAVGVISVLFARLADVVQTGFHVLLGTGVGSTLGLVFGGSAGIAALLGMAGYFAGVVQAPMPAFAITLRMIGNHDNVIALMCASVLGCGTARVISRESLYHALSRLFIADAIRRRRAETVMTNPVAQIALSIADLLANVARHYRLIVAAFALLPTIGQKRPRRTRTAWDRQRGYVVEAPSSEGPIVKSVSAAALLLLLSLVPAVAEDTACVASPTRVCVLGMAAEASEAAGKTLSTSNTDSEANERFTLVAGIWGDIFKTAAMADDPDLALSAAPAVTKQFGTLGIPELITALKLAGRDADLAALLKQLEMDDRIADMVFGPALVAAGRTGDFKTFIASRNYQPADVTAMEAAGDFLAGRPQDGLALIDALHGSFKEAAGVNALYFVLSAGRGDIAVPLVAYQHLETVNGVEACALVAQAAKDKALAEQCLAAASPLPEVAARDGAYLYAVAPQLVGALAAVGDWQEALAILKQLTPDNQMLAAEKLARFSHAPEMLPAARKAFGSPGPQARKRGGYLVRMLVLAGQADEAATFVATAPDAVTQDFWRGQQAGALAEMGDTATALPLTVQIADPVAKAFALCAVAKALKD